MVKISRITHKIHIGIRLCTAILSLERKKSFHQSVAKQIIRRVESSEIDILWEETADSTLRGLGPWWSVSWASPNFLLRSSPVAISNRNSLLLFLADCEIGFSLVALTCSGQHPISTICIKERIGWLSSWTQIAAPNIHQRFSIAVCSQSDEIINHLVFMSEPNYSWLP